MELFTLGIDLEVWLSSLVVTSLAVRRDWNFVRNAAETSAKINEPWTDQGRKVPQK
jgi:hypothetical protein